MSVDEVVVLEFLTALFNEGGCFSSVKLPKSALSSVLYKDDLTIGNFVSIERFMKGIFEIRPPMPRYLFIWFVNIVLNYLRILH